MVKAKGERIKAFEFTLHPSLFTGFLKYDRFEGEALLEQVLPQA